MFWRLLDTVRPVPELPEGPVKLPGYFPVQPVGCEVQTQKLFACINNEALAKAREMEKAGLHKSYFADVEVKPLDEKAAQLVRESGAAGAAEGLPQPGDNPLDECKTQIAYYMRCCDRELKKRKNWMLVEPYRVQEEYRWDINIKKYQQAKEE